MTRIFAAAMCCVLGWAPRPALAEPAQAPQDRFLVIPFDNPGHEARIYWLAEASAILLADDLNAAGRRAFTREERREGLEQIQVPAIATFSHDTVSRLG